MRIPNEGFKEIWENRNGSIILSVCQKEASLDVITVDCFRKQQNSSINIIHPFFYSQDNRSSEEYNAILSFKNTYGEEYHVKGILKRCEKEEKSIAMKTWKPPQGEMIFEIRAILSGSDLISK